MNPVLSMPDSEEAAIRRVREHSNRSIARRNVLGIGDSLAEDYVGIVGNGSFVASRAEYLRLFKLGFDTPRTALTYERVPERIDVSSAAPLAAEQGHWIARLPSGREAFTGVYMAMWRHEANGWRIRSETFVTLTETAV